MLKGIDISKYQGDINFDLLKDQIDFVIMKATDGAPDPGQTVSMYEDSFFKRDQSEARRVGILRGYYHYAEPSYNDPEPEAEEFVNAIGIQPGELMFLDFEESTTKDVVVWAKAWLDKVYQMTGTKPLIYLNEAMVNANDWSSVAQANYGLWVAKYGVNDGSVPSDVTTGVWPSAAFWQYTSVASAAGVHPIDADNFYGDNAAFGRYAYQTPTAPLTPTEPTPAPTANPLQQALDAAESQLQDQITQLTAADDALNAAENHASDLQAQIGAAASNEATVNAKVDELTKANADLIAQNDSLKLALSTYTAQPSVPEKPIVQPTLQDLFSALFKLLTHKK